MKSGYSILCILLLSLSSFAAILEVPTDYANLQEAYLASSENDTILFLPGTYTEGLMIEDHSIFVTSQFLFTGDPEDIAATVIDAGECETGIGVYGFNNSSTLVGFTVQNATYRGIHIHSSTANLYNLIVSDNEGYGFSGTGICCENSTLDIANCQIVDNLGSYCVGLKAFESTVTMDNCYFSGNEATSDAAGAGFSQSDVIITNSVFENNIATIWGGGVFSQHTSTLRMDRCVIAGNYSLTGGGLYVSRTETLITNCTIVNNVGGHSRSAIEFHHDPPTILNSIFWGNDPVDIESGLEMHYCDVQGGYNGENNTDWDPVFHDPAEGDFRLADDSPCIDAGTALYILDGDTVLVIPEEAYEGNAPDMGAFEHPDVYVEPSPGNIPDSPLLVSAFPNPFNSSVRIQVQFIPSSVTTITVFDLLGRQVLSRDIHSVSGNSATVSLSGKSLASGTYNLVVTSGSQKAAKKVVLLK